MEYSLVTTTLIVAIVAATLLGAFLPLRLGWLRSPLLLALLTVSAVTVIIPEAWEAIGAWMLLPLAVGIVIERYVAPCTHCADHPDTPRSWWVAALALVSLIFHAVLDGHLLSEFSFGIVGAAILFHKFMDGLSGNLISYDMPRWLRALVLTLLVAATPLGLIFLPEEVVSEPVHGAMLAFVSGLYFATAWDLFQNKQHHLHHAAPKSAS